MDLAEKIKAMTTTFEKAGVPLSEDQQAVLAGWMGVWLTHNESPRSPVGYVAMPKELTAENGAKGLLSGEFHEGMTVPCWECGGDGWEDEEHGEECHECSGAGGYSVRVPVKWTTIKEIYAMAVKHLAI